MSILSCGPLRLLVTLRYSACRLSRCILLVGTTARTALLLNLIPYGGHKTAIRAWGHMYVVVLPYVMFAIILIMIGLSVMLQATLTSSAAVGSSIGVSLLLLSAAFFKVWVWADVVLGETLEAMVIKRQPKEGEAKANQASIRPNGVVAARRRAAPVHGSSRGRGGPLRTSSS